MKRADPRSLRIDPDPDGERRRAARARLGLDERTGEPRRHFRPIAFLVRVVLCAVLLSIGAVAALRVIDPPLSALMFGEWVVALRDGDADYRLEYAWRPLAAISPLLARAVIAAEDQKFRDHHGFDFAAIEDALATRDAGGRLRGASTISQQVAKNLFLWRGRHWVRKGLEAWFTVWIELLWPKARILEIYLNVAQFGRGLYGAQAASRHFFARPARDLDAPQAALLAAALPNPLRYRVDVPDAAMRRRQAWILRQMQGVAMLKQ
ncbi:MAG: monofunctional biosynthetic peptidoglycan transglycosylase [Gammaproteobacteria bacterium]|nr:monofunctional biosynthetic peptidoglycan transglycosylase [Gammaproteobacteria bacterium]